MIFLKKKSSAASVNFLWSWTFVPGIAVFTWPCYSLYVTHIHIHASIRGIIIIPGHREKNIKNLVQTKSLHGPDPPRRSARPNRGIAPF
jgi:hypothetical protein